MMSEPASHSGPDRILGESDAAGRIRAFARRAAAIDAPVLITGETGTGKGLLARAIHEASGRARRPFVAVNCAGVADTLFESSFFGHVRGAFTGAHEAHRGFFEQAHGGTLFLDEVGELAPPLQAKLLSALEDGRVRRVGAERVVPVDVRLLAATSVGLEEAMDRGRFRRDLYHRLCVLAFRLPPLRERTGDVAFLAEHFRRGFRRRYRRGPGRFAPGLLHRLEDYTWPGNIRELAHAIEAAVVACDHDRLRAHDLPTRIRRPAPAPGRAGRDDAARGDAARGGDPWGGDAHALAGERRDDAAPRERYSFYGPPEEERRVILDALRRARGNKTRAARLLGMARTTLRQKMRALGVPVEPRARVADGTD